MGRTWFSFFLASVNLAGIAVLAVWLRFQLSLRFTPFELLDFESQNRCRCTYPKKILNSRSAEPESKTVSKLSMSEFLEYCDLCSDQKELEEAEGGVSESLLVQL